MLRANCFLVLLQCLVRLDVVKIKVVPPVPAQYVLYMNYHPNANHALVAVDMNASHIKFAKKMFFNGVMLPATDSSLTSLNVFRITVNLRKFKPRINVFSSRNVRERTLMLLPLYVFPKVSARH